MSLSQALNQFAQNLGRYPDYSQFRQESKKTIAAAASTAASIKAVLDTPLLAEDGSLTLESEKLMKNSGM